MNNLIYKTETYYNIYYGVRRRKPWMYIVYRVKIQDNGSEDKQNVFENKEETVASEVMSALFKEYKLGCSLSEY